MKSSLPKTLRRRYRWELWMKNGTEGSDQSNHVQKITSNNLRADSDHMPAHSHSNSIESPHLSASGPVQVVGLTSHLLSATKKSEKNTWHGNGNSRRKPAYLNLDWSVFYWRYSDLNLMMNDFSMNSASPCRIF